MANYNSAYTGAQIDAAVGAVANKADDNAVVHNTGNETIGGVKTFSSFPVTPSSAPTADYQMANKKYVDDNKYTHPASHPASMITDLPTGKKVARFVVGTSTSGWTAADCDYLCDGTADQVEINNAITALSASGGEIIILNGTYNITAKINVTKDNVSIRGNGNATILKRMFNSSAAEGVITLTGRSGCNIANLQIDGNKTSYTSNNNYGIYLNGSSNNNTITGNTYNNNSYGIRLGSSSNNIVIGNTCNNNNSYGIYLSNSSNNNTITGNTCNNNNQYGIYFTSSSDNTITGNTCNNNSSYGIYLSTSCDNNTITGNTCNNNNSAGIYLNSSCNNNTITGNTYNNNGTGIYLFTSCNNNTVTGNTCIRGTGLATDYTASQHTIRLRGSGNSYNLISNNNCMGKAVTNEGGTGNTLVNNKFDET
jgi:parallel beta-helix repeat protein